MHPNMDSSSRTASTPMAHLREVARLRELVSGPDGLSQGQLEAMLAGWDPASTPLVQFLVARGVLDRLGAQTLSTVLKGYVQLRGASLCALFKPVPSAARVPERGGGTPAEVQPGARWARYTLLRRLGQGAHSQVFQARHDLGQRTVALKVPRGDAAPSTLPRFAVQARIHARWTHDGVLPLLDASERAGEVYLVHADMDTSSIASYLEQLRGRVQAWTLAQLFVDVAQVLDVAAGKGIVHGNLTPSNILMCQEDTRVRLTDFGMRIPGLPGPFTAPELAQGGEPTAQSDMYSLGLVLQHAACGSDGPLGPLQQRRPDLPHALVTALERLTAASPHDRPASWDAAIAAMLAACPRVAAAGRLRR